MPHFLVFVNEIVAWKSGTASLKRGKNKLLLYFFTIKLNKRTNLARKEVNVDVFQNHWFRFRLMGELVRVEFLRAIGPRPEIARKF